MQQLTHHAMCIQARNKVWNLRNILIVCGLFFFPSWSFGMDGACRTLFTQKRFIAAAQCFQALTSQVDQKKQFASMANLLKDRFLTDAAISYNNASTSEKDIQKRGYLKEQAIALLQRTQKEGLCKSRNRCLRNTRWIEQFKNEIQYGRLIVFTGRSDARIHIVGYKLRKQKSVTFNEALRPGRYTIRIMQGQKEIKRKTIELKPNHSAVMDARPAKIRVVVKRILIAKKIPPLVLTGYIIGGALLIGGAVVTVLGYMNQSTLNTCRQDPSCPQPQDVYNREFDQAGVLVTIGYVGAITGMAVIGGGIIAHTVSGSPSKKPPPSIRRSLSLGSYGFLR